MIKIHTFNKSSVLQRNVHSNNINLRELRYVRAQQKAIDQTIKIVEELSQTQETSIYDKTVALYQTCAGFIKYGYKRTQEEFTSDFKDVIEAIKSKDLKRIKINKQKLPVLFAITAGIGLPIIPGAAIGGYVIGKLTLKAYNKLFLKYGEFSKGQCNKLELEKMYKEFEQALRTDIKKVKK